MDLNYEQIKIIVEKSLWYPSGDNCQPWTFVWGKRKLRIYHSWARAAHPLNPNGIASCLSLGCLVEALSISASCYGNHIEVQYHDFLKTDGSCWASVEFLSTQQPEDPLLKFIGQRATDRRLFSKGDLPSAAIENAVTSGKDLAPAGLHCLEKMTPELTDYIIQSEKLIMDHPQILPKILEWTRFSADETQHSGDGLSLKNMGIRFWETPTLLLIKKYPKLLQVIKGILIPQHMNRVRKQLNSSAGLVCVSIPKQAQFSPQAGRMMYRAWLELTKLGFGVQPLTIASTLVFCAHGGLLDPSYSQNWTDFFKGGEEILRRAFKIPVDHLPIWMIRTGRASALPKDLRTLRKPIQEVLRYE